MSAILIVALAALPSLGSISGAIRRNRPILMLTALAMVSALWSQFPDLTLKASTLLITETVLAYFIFVKFRGTEQLQLVWIIGTICLLFSFYCVFFAPAQGVDHSGSSASAWQGMYGQKNTCAMMTVFMLSACLHYHPKSGLARMARLLYVILSILLVIMADSASGKLLLCVLLIYYFTMKAIFMFRGRDRTIVAMAAASFISLLGYITVSYRAEITYLLGKDPTFTSRTLIWGAAMISVFKRPLLGYGYSAFWRGFQGEAANVSLMNGWSSVYAHNGYIDMLTALGCVGLVIFLLSAVVAVRNAVRLIQRDRTPLVEWSFCIIVLTLVLNLSEVTVLRSAHLLWIFYVLAYANLAAAATKSVSPAVQAEPTL
jgi:O-antigen ligase